MINDDDLETLKRCNKNIGQLAYYAYNYSLWKFRTLKDDEIYDELKFLDTLINFDDLLDSIKNLWITLDFIVRLSVDEFEIEDGAFGLMAYNIFCEHIIKIYPEQKCMQFDEIPEDMKNVWHMTAHIICDKKQEIII